MGVWLNDRVCVCASLCARNNGEKWYTRSIACKQNTIHGMKRLEGKQHDAEKSSRGSGTYPIAVQGSQSDKGNAKEEAKEREERWYSSGEEKSLGNGDQEG